jgi:hypothetical protein
VVIKEQKQAAILQDFTVKCNPIQLTCYAARVHLPATGSCRQSLWVATTWQGGGASLTTCNDAGRL